MRLLLLADTHLPRRARDLPADVWGEVDRADVVVHAGDWTEEALLDRIADRLGQRPGPGQDQQCGQLPARLLACWGNNDGPGLRARLPEVAYAELDGVRIGVVHETGGASGRERRADTAYPDLDVLVFGHSHIPWDTTTPGGLRLLNPGSPTDRRRQPVGTYAVLEVAGGAVTAYALHAVPVRSGPGPRVTRGA